MEHKKRIIFVSPTPGFGGAEHYMLTLAERGREYGYESFVSFEQRPQTELFIGLCREKSLKYSPCRIANEMDWNKSTPLQHFALKMLRSLFLLQKVKPDIVHLTLPNPLFGLHVMLAAALLRIPVVVVFQWVGDMLPIPQRKRSIYDWCRGHRQQWVAVSSLDAHTIRGAFNVTVEAVIQNAAMPGRIVEKENYGIAKDEIKIVTVGRIGKAKGHDLIVQAITHIIEKYPRCRFIWIGSGENAGVTHLIQKYNVADYIVCKGFQSSVADELAGADMFLLPSRSEGQSFALSEAMAAGVPILCSDAGGSPEVIRDKENGVLFYADDACSLLNAVTWGIEHYDQMIGMGKQAQIDYKKYTGEMMVKDTFQMMHEMLNNGIR